MKCVCLCRSGLSPVCAEVSVEKETGIDREIERGRVRSMAAASMRWTWPAVIMLAALATDAKGETCLTSLTVNGWNGATLTCFKHMA